MKGTIGTVLGLLVLAGCAASAGDEQVARNPHHLCSEDRLAPGTEAYAGCVEAVVAERCGAEADARCTDDLLQAAFLARQLELRGYRLFGQSS